MLSSFEDVQGDVIYELESRGLQMTPSAMKPLREINFSRLVDIHDHEEAFLREQLISNLVIAYNSRISKAKRPLKVNSLDVRTAMLMLGAAVAAADNETFSAKQKSIIKDICPFCSETPVAAP